MAGKIFFVTVAVILLETISGFPQLLLKEGIVYLSDTSKSIEITIVSISNMLNSVRLNKDEFWMSVAYSEEIRQWTCVTNEGEYRATESGVLERYVTCTSEARKPKVTLFDVLTLIRLQTPENIVAAYLCTDNGTVFWRVFTKEEVYFVDSAKPIVFKIESSTDRVLYKGL